MNVLCDERGDNHAANIAASEMMKGEKQIIKCLDEMRVLGTRKCLLLKCLDRHEIYAQISSFVKQIYENMLSRQKEQLRNQAKIKPYLVDRLTEFNEKDLKRMNILKDELKQIKDIEVNVKLLYGSPSLELITMINEQTISLVVMGN